MNAPANAAATVTALIADDEPLLAQALQAELAAVWPALHVRAVAANGRQALEQLVASPVDIAFLDIRMPGLTGLEVGQRIAATWADSAPARALVPAPLIVFVTAYGEFALEAFESAAVDYLIKPVTRARLQAWPNLASACGRWPGHRRRRHRPLICRSFAPGLAIWCG